MKLYHDQDKELRRLRLLTKEKKSLWFPKLINTTKWICFAASAVLVMQMIGAGLPVSTHPIHPDYYIVPDNKVSAVTLKDLLGNKDFIFLASVTFLFSPTGSNQTYTSAASWNDASNSIQCIGAGGSGPAVQQTTNGNALGGGGGEYRKISSFSFAVPGTTTATWQAGTGGALVQTALDVTVATAGNNGGDTWFNGTTFGGATCAAQGGRGGTTSTVAGNPSVGGLGGTGGTGAADNADGGRGGNLTGVSARRCATGGGGAGGPSGAGTAGGDINSASGTNGGQGNGTSGGTGGAGVTNLPGAAGNGNPGTDLGAKGCGGGGGGSAAAENSATVGGTGGDYGGGGGGCTNGGAGNSSAARATSGAGGGGLVVLTWTPVGGAFVSHRMFLVF